MVGFTRSKLFRDSDKVPTAENFQSSTDIAGRSESVLLPKDALPRLVQRHTNCGTGGDLSLASIAAFTPNGEGAEHGPHSKDQHSRGTNKTNLACLYQRITGSPRAATISSLLEHAMSSESADQDEKIYPKDHPRSTVVSHDFRVVNRREKPAFVVSSRNATERTPHAPQIKRNRSMSNHLCDWSSECPSVEHLLDPNRKSGVTGTDVYPKPPFKKMSRPSPDSKTLDVVDVEIEGFQRMQQWFPDIHTVQQIPMKTENIRKSLSRDPVQTDAFGRRLDYRPDSDIGALRKLPGEIRNRVYRYALLEEGPVKVDMARDTRQGQTLAAQRSCSQGACVHTKLSHVLPIAATCRQIHWEATAIFCGENTSFEFDTKTVRNACVGNYLRSLGCYADLIRSFEFLLKLPIMVQHPNSSPSWARDAILRFVLTRSSAKTGDHPGPPELRLKADVTQEICYCGLQTLVSKLNTEKLPVGRAVRNFADSEELSDLVWRCNKNNRPVQFLPRCECCGEWSILS